MLLLYEFSTAFVVIALPVVLIIGIELGHWLGRRFAGRVTDEAQDHIRTMKAALLGMISLLLAFTFSQALERFNARSAAVVDEANAIGTAVLRADLVPESTRDTARTSLKDYLEIRAEATSFPIRSREWRDLILTAERQRARLWKSSQQVVASNDGPISSLYVQSINEVIDSYGRRKAEMLRHVPPLVNLLLITSFLLACFVVGFSSGAGEHRPPITSCVVIVVFGIAMFLVVDLDRPRRGPIQISREPLRELRDAVIGNGFQESAVTTR